MSAFKGILSVLPLFCLSLDTSMQGTLGPLGMTSLSSLSAFLLVAWSTMRGVAGITQAEIDQHLEMGKRLFATGQLADALTHYHAAVEGDPKNYMNIYRRATVFLAMGKSKSAVPDLDTVLKLKPDFTAARLQRANVKLKQGRLDEAKSDYEYILSYDSGNGEAVGQLNTLEPLRTEIAMGKELYFANDFHRALEVFNSVLERCPWNAQLHEMRAECFLHLGDLFNAASDIRRTTKLIPDNTAGYLQLSNIYYRMGDAEQSLTEIRECLKLDQEHKACHQHYKKVKKLFKQIDSMHELLANQQWDDCLSKAHRMLETEPDMYPFVMRAKGHLCHCHAKAEHIEEAFTACNEVLKAEPHNLEALCDRADTYILDEQYEKAIDDFREAESVDNNHRRAQEGVKRAQKLLKQSQKRDYYKILGVKRNAQKKEILKAYRKLAAEWHPDKHQGDDKEKAEKMFRDIAAAKEVLTDPELRKQFDSGSDPLDPEEQQQQQHPFHQGFNPFGGQGGGFNFKFHFN